MRISDPPLLLVTDRLQARRPMKDMAAAALRAGCRWLSLREKDLPADELICWRARCCRRRTFTAQS